MEPHQDSNYIQKEYFKNNLNQEIRKHDYESPQNYIESNNPAKYSHDDPVESNKAQNYMESPYNDYMKTLGQNNDSEWEQLEERARRLQLEISDALGDSQHLDQDWHFIGDNEHDSIMPELPDLDDLELIGLLNSKVAHDYLALVDDEHIDNVSLSDDGLHESAQDVLPTVKSSAIVMKSPAGFTGKTTTTVRTRHLI